MKYVPNYNDKQIYAWNKILCNNQYRKILFDGGARSGKTYIITEWMFQRAFTFPRSRQLVARLHRTDAKQSLWNGTFKDYIFQHGGQAIRLNESELILQFPNGSTIQISGLDDKERLEKILGTEYSTVFLNEATQLSWEAVQMVVTRLSQKVYNDIGNAAMPKLIMDCNPRGPRHWLYKVGVQHVDPESEKPLKDAEFWARLNWSAYDNIKNLSSEYIKTYLETLPDIKRARMLDGKWVSAEGLVYSEFEDDTHTVDPFPIPQEWTRIRAIDFGYTNPFVCLWGALDPDGRLYIYREIYRTQSLTAKNAKEIKEISSGENFLMTTADHDAEERAELNAAGIPTTAAKKDVTSGIQAVKRRLMVQGDGKPRIFFFSNLKNILSELSEYEWLPPSDDRNAQEVPKKFNDHAMDAMRYMVMAVDSGDYDPFKAKLMQSFI